MWRDGDDRLVALRPKHAGGRRAPIRILLYATALLQPLGAKAAPPTLDVVGAKAATDSVLDRIYPHLKALYEDIHAHPELSFEEKRTAALLAAEMRRLGFTVTEHVGGTGIVALFRNGPGPTVMVRTELDALPMEEKTGLPYASRVQAVWNGRQTYVAHSCGHDLHMAAWVGAATALVVQKERWRGTLMFIGQPAEETVGGAVAMLKDGLFKRFPKPDYGLALHSAPMAAGDVFWKAGPMTSNDDNIVISFKGRGGHGSMPQATIDPVLIAARFVVDVQAIVSREKDPQQVGVVTIAAIEGGSAGNIIPDHVTVRGTIRSYSDEIRARLIAGVKRTALAEAAMASAPLPDMAVATESTGAVVNDAEVTARTGALFQQAFGVHAVELPLPLTASEDYSAFIKAGLPSLFFLIGVYDPARIAAATAGGAPIAVNHSPYYAPHPEPTITTGVKAMTLAVMNLMPVEQ